MEQDNIIKDESTILFTSTSAFLSKDKVVQIVV